MRLKNHRYTTLFFVCLSSLLAEFTPVYAQELNCTVTVNSRQIGGSSYDYVSELKPELESYINQNRWSNDRYEDHERVQCNLQIVLSSVDNQFNFTGEALFSVRRPIYNSNQQTTSIVISDNNWRFNYPRNKNLIQDDLQFDDLTSFIDFYVLVMLGFDYDTFSEQGGTAFYNRALSVFELGQNSGAQGWGRSIGAQRNRFGLIQDLTNPAYDDLRKAVYRYHRLGLDQFTLDPVLARNSVVDALLLLRDNKRITSNNYLFDLFFSTKYTEIVAILMDANRSLRLEAYNILRDVDPAHSSEYNKLQH